MIHPLALYILTGLPTPFLMWRARPSHLPRPISLALCLLGWALWFVVLIGAVYQMAQEWGPAAWVRGKRLMRRTPKKPAIPDHGEDIMRRLGALPEEMELHARKLWSHWHKTAREMRIVPTEAQSIDCMRMAVEACEQQLAKPGGDVGRR